MNSKIIFGIIFLMIVLLSSSCNRVKERNKDNIYSDSIISNTPLVTANENVKNQIVHYDIINVDTIIGNYKIKYKTEENSQYVITYPYVDNKGIDTVLYACHDAKISIEKDGNYILSNKVIKRSDFNNYIPIKEIEKYDISNLSIKEIKDSELVFDISFCIPETDIYYPFELVISDNGIIKIKEVLEDSDM